MCKAVKKEKKEKKNTSKIIKSETKDRDKKNKFHQRRDPFPYFFG